MIFFIAGSFFVACSHNDTTVLSANTNSTTPIADQDSFFFKEIRSSNVNHPFLELKSEKIFLQIDNLKHNLDVILNDGSFFKISYQDNKERKLALNISFMLNACHHEFLENFTNIRPIEIKIILVKEQEKHSNSKFPNSLHALYYKKNIYIPISNKKDLDYMQLYRLLRHEYTHAIVSNLSSGRCPSWIDEGLAEWFDGSNHNNNYQVLTTWLKKHPPLPLKKLRKGFLTLPKEQISVAYAQSLFAVEDLINTYGIKTLNKYFQNIQMGYKTPFQKAFGISERAYEKRLNNKLKQMAKNM